MRLPWVPRGPKRKPARSMAEFRGRVAKVVGMNWKMRGEARGIKRLDGKFAVYISGCKNLMLPIRPIRAIFVLKRGAARQAVGSDRPGPLGSPP